MKTAMVSTISPFTVMTMSGGFFFLSGDKEMEVLLIISDKFPSPFVFCFFEVFVSLGFTLLKPQLHYLNGS